MSTNHEQEQNSTNGVSKIIRLAQACITCRSLEEFERSIPQTVSEIASSPQVVLYLVDSRLPGRRFIHRGVDADVLSNVEELCIKQSEHFAAQIQTSASASDSEVPAIDKLTFYPLRSAAGYVGLIGLATSGKLDRMYPWNEALQLIAETVNRLAEQSRIERQLAHLNAYLTVSSMLSQSMGLQELLQATLYCSMEVVKAEAASVLLLDEEKKNLTFYQIEGPAKPLLATSTFPADRGIAGSVLQTQQSEIINDAAKDPRFYGNVDAKSGFVTRNMIAVPLAAGEEHIGVLEVLNKTNGESFSQDEHLLLRSIADQVAFAIRNAKVFEYVVNSYCKQRQGQASCKGCNRPLGSWTPCAKYRDATV